MRAGLRRFFSPSRFRAGRCVIRGGEFANVCGKGLAEVLDIARKRAPLVPHDGERLAKRFALVRNSGKAQRIAMEFAPPKE